MECGGSTAVSGPGTLISPQISDRSHHIPRYTSTDHRLDISLSLSRCCCFPLLTANSSQSTSDTTMSGSPPSFARTMPWTGMWCGGRWTSSKNLVYDLWYHHNTEWLLTRTHMSRVYKIETDNNYNVSLGDFISLKYHILLSIAVLYSQPTLSWYQWKIFQSGQTISFNAVLNWW